MSARWLGLGLGLRRPLLRELLAEAESESRSESESESPGDPPVLEVIPAQVFTDPKPLERLAPRHQIVIHDVDASLATAGPDPEAHLDRVAALAERCGAALYSDHLAITRSPSGLDLGHLLGLRRTRVQLELLIRRLRLARQRLAIPVAVELPTTTLELPGHELDEGAFVTELVERSGCELVLDLENLRIDADNRVGPHAEAKAAVPGWTEALAKAGVRSALRPILAARLAALPLAAVACVHVAGGHASAGWTVDSHAHPVSADSLAVLRALRGRIQPRAIILERDAALPSLAELRRELAQVRSAWSNSVAGTGPR